MNITNLQLKTSYWLINYGQKIKKFLTIALVIIDAILLSFNFYQIASYIGETAEYEKSMTDFKLDLIDWQEIHKRNQPQSLEISNFSFVPLGNSKYDLAAQINNPNFKWLISNLTYKFVWDGGEARGSTFLLAPDKKVVLILNKNIGAEPKNLDFDFLEIKWEKIDAREKVYDFKLSDIAISDIYHDTSLNKVYFTAQNNSAYGFWETRFKVTLWQGQKMIAANEIPISKFLSGEKRMVEVPFSSSFSSGQIRVEPEVNILDKNNFFLPVIEPDQLR